MADNVTTDELEQALQDLATEMGVSVQEYVTSLGYATVADVQADVNGLQSQITAITEMEDNGVESLAEKIKAIHDVVSDSDGVVQAIFAKIQENAQAISDETTRATGIEADLQSQITDAVNAGNTNATNVTALQGALSTLTGRVDVTEADLATLKGDETVTGSIANLLKAERDRAVTKEGELQTQLDANAQAISDLQSSNGASLDGLDGRVSTVENTLNDTTDADGNLVKGIVTRVGEVETAVVNGVAEAKAYADSVALKASSMDMCGIANKFRQALGLADKTCDGSGDGDGAVL